MIGRKFGQHEPLTTRLHNLVRSYPKGLGVFKEFIQNADDAEAEKIVFVIDEQEYDTARLPPKMQWLHQTPSLLVYNDKPFTESDIEGIQRIGDSGKSDSLGKAGRYGLGFNACYNVTDVPSFFTNGTFFFFDPHCNTIPEANVNSPGRCFGVEELTQEGWPLLDSIGSIINGDDEFDGTVFRLPFRTNKQSSNSKIKRDTYTVEDVLGAVQELRQCGSSILLFLKNVRHLEVRRKDRSGSSTILISIRASNPGTISSSRKPVNDLLSSADPARILAQLSERGDTYSSCIQEYIVEVEGSKYIEKWRVVDGFFLDADHAVLRACEKMLSNEEKALPYAGAAWAVQAGRRPSGSISCFLPVPMQTILPIQLNGYFDLDDSRQNMFLDHSAHGTAHTRVEWNEALLKTSASKAYVKLLEDLRLDLGETEISSYYEAFPQIAAKEDSWEGWLTRGFYKAAADLPLLRCSRDPMWCKLSEIRTLPDELKALEVCLIEEGELALPSPQLPSHVVNGYQVTGSEVAAVAPIDLRNYLECDVDVDCVIEAAPRSCLRKREYIPILARFCLRDDPEDGLLGLPLVLDCRGHLRTPGMSAAPLYFSDLKLDMEVFWDHPNWFIDPAFVNEVGLQSNEDAQLFHMNSECFVRELSAYVLAHVGDADPILSRARSGTLTGSWLTAVFSRLLQSDLGGLEYLLNEIPLVPDQTGELHKLGTASTPLIFRGSRELKRALTELSVPLVSGVSEELVALLIEFSRKQSCIWTVTPRDLIDTLVDVCAEALDAYGGLTEVQMELLTYLSRDDSLTALKEVNDRCEKLRSLKLFPTAKGSLVTLSETAYISQDFNFPAVDFDVELLNDGPSHRWRPLYLLLEVPELSRTRLILDVILPGFAGLDDDGREESMRWVRDNLSLAQNDADNDSENVFEAVRNAEIIVCSDAELRSPSNVYQPESKLASAVLGAQAAFPDMDGVYATERNRWLEFFRQLDMPVEPRLRDVLAYIQQLTGGKTLEESSPGIQAAYGFIKDRVDSELQGSRGISSELGEVLAELADIPWLPLRQESGDFLCFKAPEHRYGLARDTYFPRVGQLVASQASITLVRPEPGRRARELMGFPVSPSIDLVVSHFLEVLSECSTPERTPRHETLMRALAQIYRYLGGEAPQEQDDSNDVEAIAQLEAKTDLKSTFAKVPCIWDRDTQQFWRPDHVFTDNVRYMEPWRRTIRNNEDAIERGYTALGRRQEPDVDDWKQVLIEISESSDSPVGVVREVLRRIVEVLADEEVVDGDVLVPTRDGRMVEANSVFLADAPWYEPMLDDWEIPVLAPSVSSIFGIEAVLGIRSLDASIEQRLANYPVDCEDDTVAEKCRQLEQLLRTSEFSMGLRRLLRHEGQEASDESLSFLQRMTVRCVQKIDTCLYLCAVGGEQFLGEANTETYWDLDSHEAMVIESRSRYFYYDLASLVSRALREKPLKDLAPLVHMLQCEAGEISNVLDDLKVRALYFEPDTREEFEDDVTPQEFPEDLGSRDEDQSPVESGGAVRDPLTRDAILQGEQRDEGASEQQKAQDSDNANRQSSVSTASRPQAEGSKSRGHAIGGRSPSRDVSRPSRPTTTTDMEKSDPHSGTPDSSNQETTSRRDAGAQRRLVSYVSPSSNDATRETGANRSRGRERRIGETAVSIVLAHERGKGRQVREMAHQNPGYDVVSEGADGERYIEVKGTEAAWGVRGVGVTSEQFFYARENPDRDHWLYVVENVFSHSPRIHEIHNPSALVDRFVFDGGWAQVAKLTVGTGVEMELPTRGDEVVDGQGVIGVVESILPAGKFPLVSYRDESGRLHKKLLADLTLRKKG